MTNPETLDRLRRYAELADHLEYIRSERDRIIVRARAEGYTLSQVADAAGVDQSRVSRIARSGAA